MPFRVFVDANVLVPGRWRDIVLTLAAADLFEILWSPLVLEEADRHLPASMDAGARAGLFTAMNDAFPEALVEWPGEVDIHVRLDVNEKDRHVVAAALWGHADVLLTEDENLHNEVNRSRLIDAQRMPVFLTYAIDVSPAEAVAALVDMARRRWLRDPNATDSEVLERLRDYFDRHGWPTGVLGP